MSKCPKCGSQCEDGAKFCDECGAPLPQDKECPKCHAHIGLNAKFCDECGFSFENGDATPATISMGDKNVIAGDVVAHKESYDIKGNATIVRNEDESKKMVKCSGCGKNIPVSQSFECLSCHQIVCEDCFDAASRKCKKCCCAKSNAAEESYRAAIEEALSDGKIDVADRKKLMGLQKQLSLSAARAIQIEKEIKAASTVTGENKNTVTLDKVNVDKAYKLLYVKGDYKKAAELLAPIRERNQSDENVLTLYLAALTKFNPVKARKVVEDLHADVLAGALALIDIDLKRKDLASVEKRIATAIGIWPESVLLKCRKAVYAYEMFKATEDSAPLMEAAEVLESITDCSGAVEKSWKFFAKSLIDSALGDTPEQVKEEECSDKGLLWDIVSQNEDKSNALYRIIDLSDGPSAKYYPSYYMNTESVFDWSDEFKTDLMVLRRIEPGRFVMGKGSRVFDITRNSLYRADVNKHPAHIVTITNAYYIGVYEVTQGQWELITGNRQSDDIDDEAYRMRPAASIGYDDLRGSGMGLKWPVSKEVDSDSVVAMLRRKTNIANIDLPTEAQWEYACRAGTNTDFNDGRDILADAGITKSNLAKIACFGRDLDDYEDGNFGPAPVGSYAPNQWGLYDMHGNVAEFCIDANPPHNNEGVSPSDMPQIDPVGFSGNGHNTIEDVEHGCVRGGTWNDSEPEELASWAKLYDVEGDDKIGVRFAIVPSANDPLIGKWLSSLGAEIASISKSEFDNIVALSVAGSLAAKFICAKVLYSGTPFLDAQRERAINMCKELSGAGYGPAQTFLGECELNSANVSGAVDCFEAAAAGGDIRGFSFLKKLLRGVPDFCNNISKYLHSIDEDEIYVGGRLKEMLPTIKEFTSKFFNITEEVFPQRILGAIVPAGDELGCDEDDDVLVLIADDGVYVINGWSACAYNRVLTWRHVAKFGEVKRYMRYLKLCSEQFAIIHDTKYEEVLKKIVAIAKEYYKPMLTIDDAVAYDDDLAKDDVKEEEENGDNSNNNTLDDEKNEDEEIGGEEDGDEQSGDEESNYDDNEDEDDEDEESDGDDEVEEGDDEDEDEDVEDSAGEDIEDGETTEDDDSEEEDESTASFRFTQLEDNYSDRKRILFLLIGLFAGFVGLHYKYARRNVLFYTTWLSIVAALACFGMKHEIFGAILFVVWFVLWFGGAILVKKDGDKNTMRWF